MYEAFVGLFHCRIVGKSYENTRVLVLSYYRQFVEEVMYMNRLLFVGLPYCWSVAWEHCKFVVLSYYRMVGDE